MFDIRSVSSVSPHLELFSGDHHWPIPTKIEYSCRQPRPRTAELCPFAMSRWSPSAGECAETAPARSMRKLEFLVSSKGKKVGSETLRRLRQRWFSRAHNDDPSADNRRHGAGVSSSKTSKQRLFWVIPGLECRFVNSNFKTQ